VDPKIRKSVDVGELELTFDAYVQSAGGVK